MSDIQSTIRKSLVQSSAIEPEEIPDDLTFTELGLNSLQAIEFRSELQAHFGLKLPTSIAYDHPTVQALTSYLTPLLQNKPGTEPEVKGMENNFKPTSDLKEDESLNKSLDPLITFRKAGNLPPIFLFPNGYGICFQYAGLTKYIPEGHPVYGLNNPHLYNLDLSPDSIPGLARVLLPLIRRVQPRGPYIFFGYCFGGTLALTVAAILTSEFGQIVSHLILVDTLQPSYYRKWMGALNFALFKYMQSGNLRIYLGDDPALVLHGLYSEFLAGTYEFDPEGYPGHVSFIKCRIPVGAAGIGPQFQEINMQLVEFAETPFLGWERLLTWIDLYSIPADHFTLFEDMGMLDELGRLVNRILIDARGGGVGSRMGSKGLEGFRLDIGRHIEFARSNNDSWLVEMLRRKMKEAEDGRIISNTK